MIDTTSINYVLEKMSHAWDAVTPALQGVTTEYVRYVVTRAVLDEASILVFMFVFGLLSFLLYLEAKKKGRSLEDNPLMGGSAFLFLVFMGFFIAAVVCATPTTLALTNPRMYAAQTLLEKAHVSGHCRE